MLRSVYRVGLFAALFGLLLMPSTSWGQANVRHVRDDAKIFKDDAIANANANIEKIKSKHNRDLLVETVDDLESAKATKHADKRFNAAGDGVYILFVKGPKPLIRTRVGNLTVKKQFTKAILMS